MMLGFLTVGVWMLFIVAIVICDSIDTRLRQIVKALEKREL